MYLRTKTCALVSALTLMLSTPVLAVVISSEKITVPNLDTSITGPINNAFTIPKRPIPAAAVSRQSSSLPLDRYDEELGVTTFRWNRQALQAPSFRGVEAEAHSRHAAAFYLEQMTRVDSSPKKQDERAILMSHHDVGRGPIIAKFCQELFGVEVFNREVNVLMDRYL